MSRKLTVSSGASVFTQKLRVNALSIIQNPQQKMPFVISTSIRRACAAESLQLKKTVWNKRIISANARAVASGSKRGPSSRVNACSAGYNNVRAPGHKTFLLRHVSDECQSSMALLSWHQTIDLAPRGYVCGYCGHRVGPAKGFTCSNNDTSRIYLCSFCGKPTFFEGATKQYPGAPFGNEVASVPPGKFVYEFPAKVKPPVGP
jgi:DNA-directed RNA polymerase subunit RPC12/RpoP